MNTPLARSSDPITSFMAADRVKEFKAAQHQSIMLALLTLGKAGAEQIGDLCDLDAYQVRKRLSELCKNDLAAPTGELRTTYTGRKERVWKAI